jgi:hypothetical protein
MGIRSTHNRPFVRYRKLNDEIWDVWCGKKITSDFTFTDHLKLLIDILQNVGATELGETLKAHDNEAEIYREQPSIL